MMGTPGCLLLDPGAGREGREEGGGGGLTHTSPIRNNPIDSISIDHHLLPY